MESTGLTASDVALLGNGNMGGMNNFFWVFALLILANGGFGFGRGAGDYGQFATAASQQEILFGQQFQNLDNKLDRLGNGIADATFALNNSIKDGQANVAGRVIDEGRALQTQLANCCCENQKNTDALRYDVSQMFAAYNAQTSAQIQSLKDLMQQDKVEALQAKVNSLELQSALCGVVRYPNSMSYDAGRSPFCNCNCNCGNM